MKKVDSGILSACLAYTCAEPGVYIRAGKDWSPEALIWFHLAMEATWRHLARRGLAYLGAGEGDK
jgi:hypothetical protein